MVIKRGSIEDDILSIRALLTGIQDKDKMFDAFMKFLNNTKHISTLQSDAGKAYLVELRKHKPMNCLLDYMEI